MLVCAALALSSALDFFGNHALDEVDRELRRAPSELLYREAKTLLESARNAETVFLDSGEASFAASLAYLSLIHI